MMILMINFLLFNAVAVLPSAVDLSIAVSYGSGSSSYYSLALQHLLLCVVEMREREKHAHLGEYNG